MELWDTEAVFAPFQDAVFAALFMITSLVLAIIESKSNKGQNGLLNVIESEMDAPLIKIEEGENILTPPKAE